MSIIKEILIGSIKVNSDEFIEGCHVYPMVVRVKEAIFGCGIETEEKDE